MAQWTKCWQQVSEDLSSVPRTHVKPRTARCAYNAITLAGIWGRKQENPWKLKGQLTWLAWAGGNYKTPCLKHRERPEVALELHSSREMVGEATSEETMAEKLLQLQKGSCVEVKVGDREKP